MNKALKDTIKEITAQTYYVTVENGKRIDAGQYPQLREIGEWIDSKENIFILRTVDSRADVAQKFSAITGMPIEQVKVTYTLPI